PYFGSALGKSHGFTQADYYRAGYQVRDQPDQIAGVVEPECATGINEQVGTGNVAEHHNEDRRTKAAGPDGGCNSPVERHQRQGAAQQRVKQPTKCNYRYQGEHCNAVRSEGASHGYHHLFFYSSVRLDLHRQGWLIFYRNSRLLDRQIGADHGPMNSAT